MALQPHEQRMIEELSDLGSKVSKLWNFINGEAFKALQPEDAELLKQQHEHMSAYFGVLNRRVNRINA